MDKLVCPCSPITSDNLRPFDIKPTNQESPTFIYLTFEPTVVGTVAKTIIFTIPNEGENSGTYTVQAERSSNPIYSAFYFEKPKANENPLNLEYEVTYRPKVPHEKDVDYVQIFRNGLEWNTICLQGECIAPTINISIKALYFYNTKHGRRLAHTFEIQNTSKVSTKFQLDTNQKNEDQDIFKCDKIRGTLGPFDHTYVTVKFVAGNTGFYSQQLVCLIMNHAPIMIDLVGAQNLNRGCSHPDVTFRKFPQTIDETEGFSGYMYDAIKTTMKEPPPFSLSVTYLDFGRVEFQKNQNNCHILVTSLTNHLKDDIEVVWENSNEEVFAIMPKKVVVPGEESVLFECRFRPQFPDQLYSKLLTACVYWSDFRGELKDDARVEVLDLPLTATLRVLGHSFPKNKEWLPRVEICPDVVIVPPSTPMSPTYTTFMLKTSGHLPTSFKFISPKKTNFLLKPRVGIIHDFQIIVVQLQPDLENKKAYVERWGVELNGRTEDSVPFYLKGFSEFPSVTIGVDNTVVFDTVHPGCEDVSNVMVKNNSIHYVKYNFLLDARSYLKMDHPEGLLASNEAILLKWYFTGQSEAPELFTVAYEIQTVQKAKMIMGTPFEAFVTVYTKSAYSELCATPNSCDFGEICWDTKLDVSFHLFNFGEAPIHFKLTNRDPVDEMEQLTIVPSKGTVNPRDNMKIMVHVRVPKTGLREINIMYQIRLGKQSNVVINNGQEKHVYSVQYYSTYPTVQVEDISGNNFGFLFDKAILWDMFKIDELNKTLREIQHDQTKTMEIFVPDYEIGDENFFVTLRLQNTSHFSAGIELRREKLCDCKFLTKSRGLSKREKVYDCLHREMLKLSLSNHHIEPKHQGNLRMEIKYLERGLTKMMYVITLSDNRKIHLYININVLPEEVTVASTYTHNYDFKLQNTFIGEKEPPAQAFPLYNNSEFSVDYEIDVTPMKCLNFEYDFDIFKCLNPKGTVLPFTSKNILFSFVPIEARSYSVAVPLKMGTNEFTMHVFGEGIVTYTSDTSNTTSFTMPASSKAQYLENPIELSTDHLILEPFSVWSTTEKLLFIRNQTADRIIGYSWQPSIVEGTAHLEVVYRKGVLQPKESHAVIIRIQSFDQPCRLRLQMVCKLLDHTQHILHKESAVAYDRKNKELEGQFTITEEGVFYPKNDVVVLPKARPFYVTLAVSLCIISIPDMDLFMDKNNQLEQSPQYSLQINMDLIFSNYFKDVMSNKFLTLEKVDRTTQLRNSMTQQECCTVRLRKDISKTFEKVLECLIADTVLSQAFCKVIEITNNAPQPYYLQFNMDDDQDTDDVFVDVEKRTQKCVEKRVKLVENFFNKPQAPFLANVFKELIADGIHEVFQLGPQIKNRPNKPYIYYSSKSKFTCPSCNCNYETN